MRYFIHLKLATVFHDYNLLIIILIFGRYSALAHTILDKHCE